MENEKKDNTVTHFVLEGILNHFSTIIKRLIIVLIIILALWAATIAGFLWYISLPVEEYDSTVVTQDLDGDLNTMIGVQNGETESISD